MQLKLDTWHILHIDDDADDRLIVADMLNAARGQRVTLDGASTLEEGRQKLLNEPYQAVLVDYDLQVGTGIDLIREFVARGYDAPLILLTGRGSYDVDMEAMQAGATLYMTKTEINPLLLERSIRYAIERKQAEQALMERDRKLTVALDAAELGTWVYYFDDRRFEMDARAQGMYRTVTPVESHDRIVEKYLHPDDVDPMWAALERAMDPAGDGRYQVDYRVIQPDGGVIWLSAWGSTQFEGEGDARKPVCLMGASRDITWENQAEVDLERSSRALRETEARLRDLSSTLQSREQKDDPALSEAWFEKIFRANPAGIALSRASDGIYLDVNDRFCQMLGYSREELVGRPAFDLGVLTDPAEREALINKIHTQGSVRNQEVIVRLKSGGRRHWLVSAEFIELQSQTMLLAACTDVTERRQIEDQAHRLADSMPQIVWTARPDGSIDYVNRRHELYSGIVQVAPARWEWTASLHPKDMQSTLEIWNRAIQAGEIYQIEHRMRMADGSFRWHLSRCVPAYDDHGRLMKWYGTSTDIHDYRQIKKTLRQREQRLRRLFDSSLIGIVARQPTGTILEANDAYLQIIGYSCEDVEAGKINVADITPPEYYPLDEYYSNQVLMNGFCRPFEKEYLRKDGTRVPVLVGYSLFEAEEPEFIGYVLDLSELKQTQAELEVYTEKLKRSNEELENFAFIASHDLQEPLRKIVMFGNSLRRQLNGQLSTESEDYLARMQNAAERMKAMITGLLELSRVNTRDAMIEPVDLTGLANEVVSDLDLRIRSTGGQVIVGELPVVEGDTFQLRRLFQNLISNGLKYHREGVPPVMSISSEIVVDGKQRFARILVRDNGIGFEQTHAEDIFQPFVRLHGRSQYEGTGMGLAICRRIVERHGGTLTAEGQPGEGATFFVTFPLRDRREPGF